MVAGHRNSDLGHIFSGDELRWRAQCDCGWVYVGEGQRKATVIREGRKHLAAGDCSNVTLLAVVHQQLRKVAS